MPESVFYMGDPSGGWTGMDWRYSLEARRPFGASCKDLREDMKTMVIGLDGK